jgi:hypothetical protein
MPYGNVRQSSIYHIVGCFTAHLIADTVGKHAHNAVYSCIHIYLRQVCCITTLESLKIQQIIDDASLFQVVVIGTEGYV